MNNNTYLDQIKNVNMCKVFKDFPCKMSYDEIVKSINKGEKIYALPLRVVYYCRVSTDSDVQLNSLDNQLDYYKNYIIANPNWEFVGGYVEEGKTGVTVEKRTSFKQMIRDASLGKFDLIITKEVSRFARDLEDSIHYIRELKRYGVGVFFENQNLNTFDSNSELILNIMFNLAQEESKKLSARVKFGHRQAIEKGHVLGASNMLGYKKDNCKLVIVEEEAKIVRKIYELYASGEYGFYKLAYKLYELGYTNKKGGVYDKSTLKRLIENPKYKGYFRGRVTETCDYRTKKRKKIPISEQIIYKCTDGSIPAIVSEELWDKANEVLNARVEGYKDNNYWSGGIKYPLSSKVYCKEHNCNFQRSHGSRRKNRPTWSCRRYLHFRISACESPIIAELDLHNILGNVINNLIPNKNKIITEMLSVYKNIEKTNQYDKELKKIDEKISKINEKKTLAIDLVVSGDIKREELKSQFAVFEEQINELNKSKDIILNQIEVLNNSYSNMQKLSKAIKSELNSGSTEEFIRKFVDEIIVSKIDNDRYNVKLDIYLNLFGTEKSRSRGARHIDGCLDDEMPYLENQECLSIEELRADCKKNKFTYNVYIETF